MWTGRCPTIYAACGSRVFEKELVMLNKKLQRHRRQSVSINQRARASAQEHQDIFRALAAGDARQAEDLAVRHVRLARENILNTVAGGWEG